MDYNKSREATDIEYRMWERFSLITPTFPVVKVSNEIDIHLYYEPDTDDCLDLFSPLDSIALDGKFCWLENALDIALFKKEDSTDVWSWISLYGQLKEICSRKRGVCNSSPA